MSTDKILQLPLELQDRILAYVPITSLVGTDLWSRNWRDRWLDFPKLNLSYGSNDISLPRMQIIAYSTLLCHRGTISEVVVDCGQFSADTIKLDLSHWLYLIRNGLQKLSLNFSTPNNKLRASIFTYSCSNLKVLCLSNCCLTMVGYAPAFQNLSYLSIRFCNANSKDLENIINTSHNLEELILYRVDVTRIEISSLKLTKLSYEGNCNEVFLKYCPRLISAYIMPTQPEEPKENPVQIRLHPVHWPPKLGKLKTNGHFIKSLAPRCKFGLVSMNLEYLHLDQVDFCDFGHMAVTFAVLKTCISLKKLIIKGFVPANVDPGSPLPKGPNDEEIKKCSLTKLRDVKITTNALPDEGLDTSFIGIITMIFSCSPDLENMEIRCDNGAWSNIWFLRKLSLLARASCKLRLKIF